MCLFKCAEGDCPVRRSSWFRARCPQAFATETLSRTDLPLIHEHNGINLLFIDLQLDTFCVTSELSSSKPLPAFVLSKVRS